MFLRALFQSQEGACVEPPTFRKLAGNLRHNLYWDRPMTRGMLQRSKYSEIQVCLIASSLAVHPLPCRL